MEMFGKAKRIAAVGGDKSRAWKDIWGCGQGIGAVTKIQRTADFVAQLKREYASARARLLAKNYA
jgi:nitronate monooxygenase